MSPADRIDQRATVALTDQQQRIVAHDHSPALVYAVAGAGKTTAMVHRVGRLVRERVFAPQRILLSSFNRAAVDDLGRALATWPHCRPVARRTLHALGYTIVRHAAERGRLPRLAHDALKVTRTHGNYMAIGDDDQTIYGFRGASMAFFRDFQRRYGAVVYFVLGSARAPLLAAG